jgi:hypothetical protein
VASLTVFDAVPKEGRQKQNEIDGHGNVCVLNLNDEPNKNYQDLSADTYSGNPAEDTMVFAC